MVIKKEVGKNGKISIEKWNEMTIEKKLILLLIVNFLFITVFILTNRLEEAFIFGKEIMDFFYAVSISSIAAIIFYVFFNYLPEKKKANIVKNNFLESYKYFKLNTIQTFLWVINEDYDDHDDLLDVKKFRDFFGDERWMRLVNNIEDSENQEHFNDLMFEIDLLHKKINVLLLSVDLPNETLAFFHRLDESLYRLQYIKKDSERYQNDYKYFWRTLRSTFSSWSFVTGSHDVDFVEQNLEKI